MRTSLQLCAQICLCLGVAGALEHGACKGPGGASSVWHHTQTQWPMHDILSGTSALEDKAMKLAQYGIKDRFSDPCMTKSSVTGALEHGACKEPKEASSVRHQSQTQ